MMRNLLFMPLLCLAFVAQAQYAETFSVASKGYKLSCLDDLIAVNWSLSAWSSPTCAAADNRDASDYFNTTAGGVLESIDLDQEVCWESPLINTVAAATVSIKMDLTWATFDIDPVAGLCEGDYIKVFYSVNGGAYTMIPNVVGGNPCGTVAYPFSAAAGQPYTDDVMINHGGITGGSTLKIKVCVFTNANAEKVTIDNVEVPEAGVTVGCAAPVLSTTITQVGCSNPNSGAIDLAVSAGTPPYTYSWTGGATTQDLTNKATGTYTVTVTDGASCTATISAVITAAPVLSLTTQVLDASCSGNTDGEIDLAVGGGVPGYTYSWTGGATTQDRTGLGTGTYSVTVTDASGCTATTSATVNVQASGAYLEQFNTPNKGYLLNFVDNFAGVAWTMSGWSPEPGVPFGRDAADNFSTSGGKLIGVDFDQEICWESPLVDFTGGTMFSVDLAWTDFDVQVDEYINVKYSIDGGGYITVPNVVGGGAGTIQYAAGLDQGGSTTVTKGGLSGSTIQIQICGNFNANAESMTIDNVSVPGSNPFCPAPEPSLTATNVTCNGAANGTITTTVTNGTAPFTYIWSDGSVTTQNRTGLAPGTYTVTVSDANSATGTASILISQPTVILLTETHVNLVCNGASTGSIDLTVSGGTGAYTYSWTGGATTQDRSGLAFGTYTVTVTDANACTKTLSTTLTQPSAIVLTETHVDLLCNGASTGSIDLTVSGGTGAYTYSWTGGVTTQDRSGLIAGTYTVTVTDANACTKTLSVAISQPAVIGLTETHVNVLCNGGSTGSIDLSVSGGTGAYTYSWTGGVTTQDRSGLVTGTYTVTVTDANACTKTLSVSISEPATIVLTETHVNVLCNGASTGSIDLTVTGGTGAYTYAWTGGATTQDPSGLAMGTYTVTVTDVNACTKSLSVTITEPLAGILLTETHVDLLCNGASTGSIDLTVTGGISPYTYAWTGGATTQDRSGLASGTYTVTVTDANTCTKTLSIAIGQPTVIGLTETHVNVLCNGASTGSIDLSVSGGTGAYTYSWTGGVTTQDRSGLVTGTYTVTVTDANACTKTLSVSISEPTTIVLTETHVNVLCNGASTGSIDLTVSGGTGAYTYSWTGGATTQDRSGLVAGTYTVTVTDANACTKSLSTTITEPPVIVLTETHVDVLCNGALTGSIDLTVSGGVSPYTYAWTGGATTQDRSGLAAGTYTVTVTDANACTKTLSASITETTVVVLTETHVNILCNGSATGSIDLTVSGGVSPYTYSWTGGATTQDRSGLAAGTYTVTVTDANACTKSLSVTITQPTAIVLTETHVNVLCNGNTTGSIDLTVSGGTGAYTYSWTGGATTQDRSGLAAGTYTVTVTDANACTKTLSTTITEPATIVLTETHVNVLCNGTFTGSIDLTVSGGVSPYTYLWTGGATTQDRSSLGFGTYTVTVTDANACTKSLSVSITETSPLVLTETHVNVLCNGNATGSIDLTVSGGTSPYTYSWTGGATTPDRSGLVIGTYTVTVTDANNCTKTLSATITEPTAVVLSTTQVNVLCNGSSTGSIDLTVSGGVSPYTYAWTGGATTQDVSSLAAGTYTVTVTDANACTKTTSVTITQPTALSPSASLTQPTNCFVANGSIDLTVSGGTGAYTYSWTGGATTQDLLNVVEGTYTVTVTDANGCTKTSSYTLDYIDIINPTITCPANINVNNSPASACSAVATYTTPTATDNCGILSVTSQSGLASGATYPVGTTTNVWRATDVNTNTSTCAFTVTVTDVTLPSITCPVNISVNNSPASACSAVVTYATPAAADNCGIQSVTLQSGLASGATYPVGTTTNVWRATDVNTNTKTCAFTVTVTDVTLPSITCPANISVNNSPASACSAVVTYATPTATDNCGIQSVTLQSGLASGSTFPLGTTTNVWRATDVNTNTSTCSFTVTVSDVTPPSIVCKPFTANLDATGNVSIVPSNVYQSGSDNCGVVNLVSVTASSFNCSKVGNNLVTLVANDGNGNSATCTATVTVKDVTLPVALCKNITANLGITGTVTVAPALVNNGSSDNCSFTLSLTPNTFTCFNIGMNMVTLQVTDVGGNTATCMAKITVKDVTAPTARCKNPTIFLDEAGQASLTIAQVNNGSSDACGISTTSISKTMFNCGEITGPNPVVLSLTDVNGNASSCLAYVTVKDAIMPTAVCIDVTVELSASGKAVVYGSDLADNSYDNCSVYSYSPVAKVYTTANLGNNNLTITVKDFSGNASTCVSVVTVEPHIGLQQPPGISDPSRELDLAGFTFNVYPNPTSGDVFIAFELPKEQPVMLRVFDLQGRMVLNQEVLGMEGDNTLPLRLGGFAPGMYLLDFQSGDLSVQKRLVVQE